MSERDDFKLDEEQVENPMHRRMLELCARTKTPNSTQKLYCVEGTLRYAFAAAVLSLRDAVKQRPMHATKMYDGAPASTKYTSPLLCSHRQEREHAATLAEAVDFAQRSRSADSHG